MVRGARKRKEYRHLVAYRLDGFQIDREFHDLPLAIVRMGR
jgi:hypothetical protein